MARKCRFLTRVLSQPAWHPASCWKTLEHDGHRALEGQPQAPVGALFSQGQRAQDLHSWPQRKEAAGA